MVIKNLQISSLNFLKSSHFQKSIENHLKCQLKHGETVLNDISDCPYFAPGGGTKALQEHFEIAEDNSGQSAYEEFCETVWTLCVALWGDQYDLEGIKDDSHESIMCRRELFSDWLETVISEKNQSKSKNIGFLEPVLNLLTCHKVTEACELAFKSNNMNLSLLLAQACGSQVVQSLSRMQLDSWKSIEADKFIDTDYLKSLMLVGGISSFDSSVGIINVYENMEWLKALAVSIQQSNATR